MTTKVRSLYAARILPAFRYFNQASREGQAMPSRWPKPRHVVATHRSGSRVAKAKSASTAALEERKTIETRLRPLQEAWKKVSGKRLKPFEPEKWMALTRPRYADKARRS